MTAKEKAIELIDKFLNKGFDITGIAITWKEAEQYALIAVDEIIDALQKYGNENFELQNMDRTLAWWDLVKTEIEKL